MSHKLPHLIHQKYRPDIDGLRAVAILAVVFFHAAPGKMPGGFIGVDIFFVISGFLISTIIFSSLERDRFSLIEFYIRRIRRVFPALILVLVAALVFGWVVLLAGEFKQLGKHVAAGAGFIQNFTLWSESGYFDNAAETKPLLHLWSLAVEEQFYIFWPLMLAFFWKSQWSFLKITMAIGVASFAWNIYLMQIDPTAAFYLPFPRFWELMIGGILAYASLHRPHWIDHHKNGQSVVGFVLIAIALSLLDKGKAFPGWWALLPTLGAFFIISAGPSAWLNKQLLANKLMIGIGLISYPLYLWHWLLLSYAQIIEGGIPTKEIRISLVLLAIVLAWLTYQFIEKPVRFGKNKGRIITALLCLMVIGLVTGLAINKGIIFPRNTDPSLQPIIHAVNDWEYPQGLAKVEYQGQGYYFADGDSGDSTLMIGDSHIEQYGPRIVQLLHLSKERLNKVYLSAQGASVPIPYIDYANGDQWQRRLHDALVFAKDKGIKKIVIGACWNCFFNQVSYKLRNTPDSDLYYFDKKNGIRKNLKNKDGKDLALLELEIFLKQLSLNYKVYLLLDNPISQEQDPKTFFVGNRLSGLKVTDISRSLTIPKVQFNLRDSLLTIAHRAGVEVIDPMAVLCNLNTSNCLRLSANGRPIYKDSHHFRPFFVRKYAVYLDKALLK